MPLLPSELTSVAHERPKRDRHRGGTSVVVAAATTTAVSDANATAVKRVRCEL